MHDAGHEVHILTGTMDRAVTERHYTSRWRQLARLGIPESAVTRLHVVTNPPITAKADYCRSEGIVMLFEDSEQWAAPCREVCTVVLMQNRADA